METITDFLGTDHKRCDDLFANAERSVAENRWEDAERLLQEFADAIEQHFTMEEQVLFLAFEEETGSRQGPTSVMRMEHTQIRQILALAQEALRARNTVDFFGNADTLNTMIQQHNMKEESILYVMTDRVLSGQREEVLRAMAAVAAHAGATVA